MLQILRNKAQSIVIQAVVVVIAIVFIFWGVGANLFDNRESALVINDEEISFQDFQIAYDRTYNNIRDQFGGNVPQGLLENLGIKEQVINQLIQEALLRQGAEEMGIRISKEDIQDTVQNMVQFQDNGRFSLEKYNSLLAANNYSPTKFEDTVRLDMLVQKASLNIGQFASTATNQEIDELYTLEKSKVSYKYVEISAGEYSDTISVTDEELAAWYPTVQDNYKTDPEVRLKYLDFSYSTIGKKLTIDDSSVDKYYQDNADKFTDPEMRGARHILFKADENSPPEVHEQQKKKAQEILELARGGEDFAELAKQYSEGPSKVQGGDLGLFTRGQMVKPFEDAVFLLETGGISEVVKTSFGYHIIKLEQTKPALTKPLSEVRDEIISTLQTDQARPLAFQLANEAYEGIIGAGSLNAYLETHKEAPIKTTDFFSRSGAPADLGRDQKFLNAAFSLKEKELSSLIETSRGYAILYADSVKVPAVPELDKVKDRVALDYKREKADEAARQSAESLLQQAKSLSSLTGAAEKGGFTVKESGYLEKTQAQQTQVPQDITEEAFRLTGKEPFPEEVLQSGESLYVIEFSGRKTPEEQLSDDDRKRYKNAIIQRKQQQILAAWLKGKRENSKVMTHKSL